MKFCFLTNELSLKHGWGRYSLDLCNSFYQTGAQIIVLTKKNAENQLANYPVYKILPEENKIINKKFYFFLINKIQAIATDCDNFHCLVEPYAHLTSKIAKQKSFFITAHGTFVNELLKKEKYQEAFSLAKNVICISHYTEKVIKQRQDLKNTVVINNGVNFYKFFNPHLIKSRPDKNIIVSVGAIKPRKGYEDAVLAIAEVKKQIPDILFFIIGRIDQYDYFEKLNSIIKKFNLQNNVKFKFNISDEELINLYYQANLFLLTPVNINGNFEGFGLVYLEANACGLPVIGTASGGVTDAIQNSYNGLLVKEGDVAGIANAVLTIFKDRNLKNNLSSNGIKWAKDHDWQKVIKHYAKLYGYSGY